MSVTCFFTVANSRLGMVVVIDSSSTANRISPSRTEQTMISISLAIIRVTASRVVTQRRSGASITEISFACENKRLEG